MKLKTTYHRKRGNTMANLTSKELGAISDALQSEKMLVCKFRAYAENTGDVELKTKYEQMAAKHSEHYDKLYGMLS